VQAVSVSRDLQTFRSWMTYDARKAPQSLGSRLGNIFLPFESRGAVMSNAHTKFEITVPALRQKHDNGQPFFQEMLTKEQGLLSEMLAKAFTAATTFCPVLVAVRYRLAVTGTHKPNPAWGRPFSWPSSSRNLSGLKVSWSGYSSSSSWIY
jgi:hypothetical protein